MSTLTPERVLADLFDEEQHAGMTAEAAAHMVCQHLRHSGFRIVDEAAYRMIEPEDAPCKP